MSARSKITYARYLASNEWKARREQALYRAQYRCQSQHCRMQSLRAYSDADLAYMEREILTPHAYRLEVHHLTYDRIGHEHPDDLIVLCPQCHADTHGLEHTDEPFTKPISLALASALEQMLRDA
jgi:hypothetical protein